MLQSHLQAPMIVNILAKILKISWEMFWKHVRKQIGKHLLAPNIVSISAVSETSQSWRKYFALWKPTRADNIFYSHVQNKVEMYFSWTNFTQISDANIPNAKEGPKLNIFCCAKKLFRQINLQNFPQISTKINHNQHPLNLALYLYQCRLPPFNPKQNFKRLRYSIISNIMNIIICMIATIIIICDGRSHHHHHYYDNYRHHDIHCVSIFCDVGVQHYLGLE